MSDISIVIVGHNVDVLDISCVGVGHIQPSHGVLQNVNVEKLEKQSVKCVRLKKSVDMKQSIQS